MRTLKVGLLLYQTLIWLVFCITSWIQVSPGRIFDISCDYVRCPPNRRSDHEEDRVVPKLILKISALPRRKTPHRLMAV